MRCDFCLLLLVSRDVILSGSLQNKYHATGNRIMHVYTVDQIMILGLYPLSGNS